ncbi:hypothetical protein ACVWXL_007764 [Bradyrhizobium sp. GM22.5]
MIGALVATLPVSAGPSYVFLALDHDAAFIAQGALSSLPVNAATIFMCLTYVVLAQRRSLLVSCGSAVAVWIVFASIIKQFDWPLTAGLAANLIAFGICIPLLAGYRHVKMPLVTRRWYDVPMRAALVATLVAIVVSTSGWVGPRISGIIALYPVVFSSIMVILHPANRRSADRRGAGQFGLGAARIRNGDRGVARGGGVVRLRRRSWACTRHLHCLESYAVGDRAAYAAQGAASAVTLRTCGAASPDTSVAKLAMTDRETLSFKLLKDQAFK